jgi:flagellar hook protein FlgE
MFSVIKTGMETALHELKVISNNIANANSTAYKKSSVSFSELFNGRTADAVEASLVGKGSNVEETRRSDGQGSLLAKGGALAVAVEDKFVDTPVANVDVFQSIRIPFDSYESPLSNLSVEENGNILATFGNEQVALATIGLVSFSNPNGLKQKGDGTFGVTEKSGTISVGNPGSMGFASIKSGHIEGSNVDVTDEMTNMIKAQQQFNGAARMMQANSDMIEKLTR